MPVVYAAIFPNGKKYIGATSREMNDRVSDHKCAYTRIDNKFYRAIKKYGFENIEWREIKRCETMEKAFLSEVILIHRHKTNKEGGYNTTIGGEGNPGREYTIVNRENISKAQKKRYEDAEQRALSKKYLHGWRKNNPEKVRSYYEKRNAKIRTSEYRQSASDKQLAYVASTPNFKEVASYRVKKLYQDKPEIMKKISQSLGGAPISVYKDGVFVATFPTKRQLCKELNLSGGNVGMVLKGIRNHTHGYTFKKEL